MVFCAFGAYADSEDPTGDEAASPNLDLFLFIGEADGENEESRAEAVVAVFAHVGASEGETRSTASPALGRLLRALTGVAPEHPEDLYDHMRERRTGLFGTEEEVAKGIHRYAELGVEHVALVTRFGGMDAAAAERRLCRLAPAA